MRVLRVVGVVSVWSTMALAGAQTAATKPAAAKPATTAPVVMSEDGNPLPYSAVPAGPPGKEDAAFKALYTADQKWRMTQRGAQEPRAMGRVQPTVLRAVDPVTQQKTLEHFASVKAQLDKILDTDISEAERLNLGTYRYQIEVLEDAQTFKDWEKPVTSLSSFWSQTQGTGQRGFRTEQDYLNYLQWLADVPRFYDENIANMRAGLARGFTPPKVTLIGRDQTIVQVAKATSADQTPFWKAFVNMPGTINTAEQARLRAEGKKEIEAVIIPEYQKLLTFWNTEYFPHAVTSTSAEDLPDGKAYYQSLIKRYTTVDMPPEEIHAFGLAEVAKIHQEMLDVMAQVKFEGDFPAFLQFMRTDPQFYPKTGEQLLDLVSYQMKEFDDKADKYFGYMPRGHFGVRPVPEEMAPYVPAGFGGIDGFNINLYDLPSRPLFGVGALTLHEAAPGHSWAGLIALEHSDLPAFRKQGNSGYSEGWALYCERLGDEMGMYHTPYERFGMLMRQSYRASRLVVDTGVHSKGWTREQVETYMHDNTALSDWNIEEETDRYISMPGQALAYYLGMSSILKERKHAEQVLGLKFNLRAFHDAVLETGPIPLPVMEAHLEAWIKGGGIGPYPEMEK
jgi:uncharacterized protein (DUF885 family)